METIPELFRKYAVETILLTLALVIGASSLLLFLKQASSISAEPETAIPASSGPEKSRTVMIDVAGAVNKPGVYEMAQGSRLKEAVAAAAGLAENADADYFSRNFNQARYLTDQEKIYIPNVQEISNGIFTERKQIIEYLTPQEISLPATTVSRLDTVHINTAEKNELENLPGVGEATATKIIQLRPYSSIEDLLTKKAVKKNIFDQIKDMVSL